MQSSNKLISIITVSYNDKSNLELTINKISMLSQRDSVEFIVIDGGSNDGSLELLQKNENKIDKWVSEPDKGIYDAMNKGIKISTCRWLNFMNAGDYFFYNDIFEKINLIEYENYALIYGDTYRRLRKLITKPEPISVIYSGYIFACHQSMFFNKTTLKNELEYDSSLDFSGDSELVSRIFLKKYNMKYISLVIANYDETGITSGNRIPLKKLWRDRRERYKRQYANFGIAGIYNSIIHKLKNEWVKKTKN